MIDLPVDRESSMSCFSNCGSFRRCCIGCYTRPY